MCSAINAPVLLLGSRGRGWKQKTFLSSMDGKGQEKKRRQGKMWPSFCFFSKQAQPYLLSLHWLHTFLLHWFSIEFSIMKILELISELFQQISLHNWEAFLDFLWKGLCSTQRDTTLKGIATIILWFVTGSLCDELSNTVYDHVVASVLVVPVDGDL